MKTGRSGMRSFSTSGRSTINDTFREAVKRHPNRVFLDFSGEEFTYSELDHEVQRLAGGLHALNVRPGDRVVTILDTGPDALISWLAINRLGAITVPINTAYKGEFLRHQIGDAGAKFCIAEADYIPNLRAIRSDLPALEHVLYRGSLEANGGGISHIDRHRLDDCDVHFADVAPADVAMLLYTSGTTGPSKGCKVSHSYISDLSRRVAGFSFTTPEDISWTPLPLFHIYAIAVTLSTMQIGGRASLMRKFSVSKFWPEIQRSKANVLYLLGSMTVMIASAPETAEEKACFGQIRALLAAPCPPSLQRKLRERFGVVQSGSVGYGQTEAGAMVTCALGEELPEGSAGTRNDTFDVRIFDENDEELPPNQVGEIVVRPLKPHVMFSGYWNRDASSFSVAGNYWHHTGDFGKFDENGYFYFVDRKKDYLRRGGENISSFEVEQALLKHPAVGEVAVHAVPSDGSEDDIKATMVLREDTTLSAPDLHLWATDRIPRFALPRFIEFRRELPKNAVGRVLKYQLRDEGVTPSTWDREKPVLATFPLKS
jgi:crotonobetaine/carnitine-CoA ligase